MILIHLVTQISNGFGGVLGKWLVYYVSATWVQDFKLLGTYLLDNQVHHLPT